MKHLRFLTFATLGFLLFTAGPYAAQGDTPTIEWIHQFGSTGSDSAQSVSLDASGNMYVTGYTSGDLGGSNAGAGGAFLTKIAPGGTEVWTKQFGTIGGDKAFGVSVDATGNAYVTGSTGGSLGGTNAGSSDAFLTKFDPGGNELWATQIGTINSDQAYDISVDASGNAYVTGSTGGSLGGTNAGSSDAFLTKFDAVGTELWTRQFGTSGREEARGVSIDASSNVYVAGYTDCLCLGGPAGLDPSDVDVFLTKFDNSGAELWTAQFGSTFDGRSYGAMDVSVDAGGNAYIAGWILEGDTYAILAKYNADGVVQWTRQIGTIWGPDSAAGVSVDAGGNVYITGYTDGAFGYPWDPLNNSTAAFLSKYDAQGSELWTLPFGTSSDDLATDVFVDAAGNAFVTGHTWGSLGGPNAGGYDAFIAKITPEPTTLSMLTLGSLAFLKRRRMAVQSLPL
jgi:hypothetical protein